MDPLVEPQNELAAEPQAQVGDNAQLPAPPAPRLRHGHPVQFLRQPPILKKDSEIGQ